jgi:hypothetical protein
VQERAAPGNALTGVIAEDQTVDALKQCLAIGDEVGATGLELLHRRLDLLHAQQWFGMRGQPVRYAFPVASRFVQPAECRQHPRNPFRIPSAAGFIPRA